MGITAKPEWPAFELGAGDYVLALSGGRDSCVLLHLLSSRRRPGLRVRAIHVNHGLQADASRWGQFCVDFAASLGIRCDVLSLPSAPERNLEAWAREARYAAISAALRPGEILLTAHHQRDQAETVLLHLLRGSGLAGLAAMADERALGDNRLRRPLLEWSSAAVARYAQVHELAWMEDPSNASDSFDRNYLRHEILPRLEARFGGVEANLARSARLLREAQQASPSHRPYLERGGLSLEKLGLLDAGARNAVLLAWLREHQLPVPRHQMLETIWQQMLHARVDADPKIAWADVELRRYRGVMYVRRAQALGAIRLAVPAQGAGDWPAGGQMRWHLPAPGEIRSLQGGETIVLRGHHRRVRGLLQEASIPPWERARLPALFCEGELLAVGRDICTDARTDFSWQWVYENELKQ